MSCINLVRLSFATTHRLAVMKGKTLAIEQHNALIDLQIKAEFITGQDIELILKRCQQIRRLVMNTDDEPVFDVINNHAPNLENLGYNSSFAIEDLNKNEIQKTKGMQVLYTNNSGHRVSPRLILPLICKNGATLRKLYANVSPVTESELQNLYSTYPNFRLANIKTLATWITAGIQKFMLRSIRGTATLTDLTVTDVDDLDALAKELLTLPPVSTIRMNHINGNMGKPSLTRLFEQYARTAQTSHQSLKYSALRYCNSITNDLLSALAEINTLHNIKLCGLKNVSTDGIINMVNKSSNQLTYLEFEDMGSVTDNVILVFGGFKKLNYIGLKNLRNVTGQGIHGLLDTMEPHILTKLVVKNCPKINNECIVDARQKIDVVEHNQ